MLASARADGLEASGRHEAEPAPPHLVVADVSRSFSGAAGGAGSAFRALTDVRLEVRKGETFCLVGESGCGKSTLARLVVGLDEPSSGRIWFEGRDLTTRRQRRDYNEAQNGLQMIFQDPFASLNPRMRAWKIIGEPIWFRGLAKSRQELKEKVATLLVQVGLSPADGAKYPHQFSGGQRQRISIARALAAEPRLLVCDEPTSALDVSVQAQVLNLLQDIQAQRGLTMLFISHNVGVVEHLASRVGVMYRGQLVECGTRDEIFQTPTHPYTRMLLDAVPSMNGARRKVRSMPASGDVPSASLVLSGCGYHPRCALATDRCREEVPAPTRVDQGTHMALCHAIVEGRT